MSFLARAIRSHKPLLSSLVSSSSSTSTSSSIVSRGFSTEYDDPAPVEEAVKGIEKSVNSVTLLGRVGTEPQLRGSDAHPVVSFSLATNVRFRPGGKDSSSDYVTKTDWHNVAVFRPYLRESVHTNVGKGQRVMVQGRIMYGSVEDQAGNVRHTTTIVAEDVIRFG